MSNNRQVIILDRETGDVTWGEYKLHIHLTHDDFIKHYPHLSCIWEEDLPDGLLSRQFELSSQILENTHCLLRLFYHNQYISLIQIGSHDPSENMEANQDLFEAGLQDWVQSAQRLMRLSFGEPDKITPSGFLDERAIFSPEFTHQLQNWDYTMSWGKAGTHYESLSHLFTIWIRYDTFRQISSWDEFAEECQRCQENEKSKTGLQTSSLDNVCRVIETLRRNFEIKALVPQFYLGGLVFNLSHRQTKIMLDIFPEREQGRYKLVEYQTSHKKYARDEITLMQLLSAYIEKYD